MKEYAKPQIKTRALSSESILGTVSTGMDDGTGSGYVNGGNAKPFFIEEDTPESELSEYDVWGD